MIVQFMTRVMTFRPCEYCPTVPLIEMVATALCRMTVVNELVSFFFLPRLPICYVQDLSSQKFLAAAAAAAAAANSCDENKHILAMTATGIAAASAAVLLRTATAAAATAAAATAAATAAAATTVDSWPL